MDWLKNLKIRHALVVIIAVALLSLTIASIVVNTQTFTAAAERNIENEQLKNQLAAIESRIRLQMSTPLELSKSITQNKFLVDWALAGEPDNQQADVIDYLSFMQSENDAFVVFWVSNVSKNYLNQNGVLKQITSEDGWFFGFLGSNKDYEIAFDYEEGTNELTAFINYRVRSNGKDLAVAGLGYSVSEISADVLSNKVGETGYVFIVDDSGSVIIHPNLSDLISRELNQFDGFSDTAARLVSKDPGYVFDRVNHQGEDFYVASVGIPDLGWKIIAMLPSDEPMSEIRGALSTSAFVNLVVAIVFILIMAWIANRITNPILHVGQKLTEMAQDGGDLTHRLDVTRNDEIGILSAGFNAIISKVNDIMLDVQETERVMTHSFDELRAMAKEIDECVQTQRGEADSVATSATEMNHSIQEVSELAQTTANQTEETREKVQLANGQVSSTSDLMNQLDESNQSTAQAIQELSDQTQTINSVVDTISSISEQTNLLALNAAIEAARAGEQGRGFAVVADEVRSLASRTQSSTAEIKDVIERLQSQANGAVQAMTKNTTLANEGSENTQVAGGSLAEVVGDIQDVTDLNTQVATATQEQTNVISELSGNVIKIADMATTVAELSQKTQQVVSELDIQKTTLTTLVSQFKTR